MPLYEYACAEGHVREVYVPMAWMAEDIRGCEDCGQPMAKCFPLTRPLNYFSESNPRTSRDISTLDLKPGEEITSAAQHRALMKRNGVEPLSDWHTSMRKSRM